eukprot:Ihof_evm2s175 gene=Ihof_evmTU2s175
MEIVLSEEAEEECLALSSIYGHCWKRRSVETFELTVYREEEDIPFVVIFMLSKDYPVKASPLYEVHNAPWCNPNQADQLDTALSDIIGCSNGRAIMFECIQCVLDHVTSMPLPPCLPVPSVLSKDPVSQSHNNRIIADHSPQGSMNTCEDQSEWLVDLYQLDHMNDRPGYTKKLVEFACGAGLVGRLLFYRHYIFVLLAGPVRQLSEWRRLMHTRNVDVARASGKPCRERKMKQ